MREIAPDFQVVWRQGPNHGVHDRRTLHAGLPPAIILQNPKYPHNLGAIVRTASCYDIKQVWFTGSRVSLDGDGGKFRIPREERMRGYADVAIFNTYYPFDQFEVHGVQRATPICIEFDPSLRSQDLPNFEHPKDAIYVFGPEDGEVDSVVRRHCHKFVHIPSKHCLNLAVAVATVLYDRKSKEMVWSV